MDFYLEYAGIIFELSDFAGHISLRYQNIGTCIYVYMKLQIFCHVFSCLFIPFFSFSLYMQLQVL